VTKPIRVFVLLGILASLAAPARAQTASTADTMAAYEALRAFLLDGGSATVSNLRLTRDRAEMTFTGTFHFTTPVLGRVTGAVFVGQGRFRAEPPPSLFERQNLQRLLNTESFESDFTTAVLRFTDDSADLIGAAQRGGPAAPRALQELAAQFGTRMVKETGANPASRLLFGAYPYPILRAAFHPFGFGQSFASMLVVPNIDSATKNTYRFLSHEASHQWWGNVVGWRSYRDQWLSEGFAVYSGILYRSPWASIPTCGCCPRRRQRRNSRSGFITSRVAPNGAPRRARRPRPVTGCFSVEHPVGLFGDGPRSGYETGLNTGPTARPLSE